MDNRDTLIWLANIEGVNNRVINILERKFGQLSYVWYADSKEIILINEINDEIKKQIIKHRNKQYYENLLEKIYTNKVKVVTYYDDDYPSRLLYICDYPKVLYLKGQLPSEDNTSIAIVGARKSTAYGRWVADKISAELAKLGVILVSGMAKGIDTQVHLGALNNNTLTVAVLGCGVDVIYPSSNRELYYKIQENGCVISEFPLGTKPFPYNFPQRNRIISGLSSGVVVIEATEKSGSLITAHHATDQGKDVFAVPGNINSLYSRGTNLLIKDGAKLVMTVEDIIEEIPELKDKYLNCSYNTEIDYSQFSNEERKILECLIESPLHCDLISHKTGVGIIELNGMLTILEMKGVVKQLPGRIYTII